MAIYMKYSSPDIKGGVKTTGFEDQTEILSFSYGIARQVGSAVGGGTNREKSVPSVTDISLVKMEDEASGMLMQEAYSGKGKATVIISFVRTDAGGGEAYLQYTLSNVMLTSWSAGGSSDDRPQETFSLNFTKIETKYITQNVDAEGGDSFPVTYDLTTQTMS
jgi:type VI secretion system secreted protein Hcp